MDNSIINLLTNILSGQNQNISSVFATNKQPSACENPASKLYPPEANIPHQTPQQQGQANIMSLISALINKNSGDITNIFSKQSTKKEEESSPSDVIL